MTDNYVVWHCSVRNRRPEMVTGRTLLSNALEVKSLSVALPQAHRGNLTSALRVSRLLFYFWSGDNQPLARQQPLCVHYVIKAFGTEATIQSLVPHLQLCPQSTDRAVTKSSVSCFADRIIHMARVFVFTGSLSGTLSVNKLYIAFAVPIDIYPRPKGMKA